MPTVPTNNVVPMKAKLVEPPPTEFLLMAGATMGDMAAAREEQVDPIIRMDQMMKHHIEGKRDLPENKFPHVTNQRGWEPIVPGEDVVDELGHRGEKDDKLGFHWLKRT